MNQKSPEVTNTVKGGTSEVLPLKPRLGRCPKPRKGLSPLTLLRFALFEAALRQLNVTTSSSGGSHGVTSVT